MRQTDKEYAEALFALAAEEGILEDALEDMRTISAVIAEEPLYISLLSSPAVPLSEKLSLIDEAFSGKACDYVVCFLKLLCEKGRADILPSVAEEFTALCQAHIGMSRAVITSAEELDGEQKKKLLEKLESVHKKRIDPVYMTDPEVLGGICVEIDGKIYDGTLRGRLRNVKEVMMDDATR